MNRSERILVILLRCSGITLLTAVVPAAMPFAWMDVIHRWIGMGTLPDTPIVGYLTRSASAMYALHGAVVFFASLDVRRYLPLVKCIAALGLFFGAGMLAIDFAVGMPLQWTISEGPSIVVLSAFMLWLAGQVPRSPATQTGS